MFHTAVSFVEKVKMKKRAKRAREVFAKPFSKRLAGGKGRSPKTLVRRFLKQ